MPSTSTITSSSTSRATPLLFRAPIFTREAATAFRRRRTYALQLAFLLALFALLAAMWPHTDTGNAATRARRLFEMLAAIELAAAALIAPALAAPGIAEERERETLGLLAIAGASAAPILWGKALGRLAQVVVLVLMSLPLVGALFAVGGLTEQMVVTIFVEAIALAALGVGLGSFFSATSRRPEIATISAFAVLFAITALPIWLGDLGLGIPAEWVSPLRWYEATFRTSAVTGEVTFHRWWVAPIVHVALGAAALVAGTWRLGRMGYEPARAGTRNVPLRRLLLRLRKRGAPLGLAGRFGSEVAALRWRERSVRAFSDGALIVLLGFFLLAFEVFVPPAERAKLREATSLGIAALATLLATVLGAAAISRERDQKTIESLAAAPIDADQFLLGKLVGLGRAVGICGIALVIHLAIGALRVDAHAPVPPSLPREATEWMRWVACEKEVPWATVIAVAGTIPFGLVLHAVIGLSASSHAQTVVRATAWSLFWAVVLGAAARFGCFFFGLSPVSFLWVCWRGAPGQGFQTPSVSPEKWLAVAVFAALLAAAVAVVAWNHLRARFDALIGRAALDIIDLPDTIPDPKPSPHRKGR